MKLVVSKEEIQEKLLDIQNIVEKRSIMPILSYFLLEAAEKGSYIVATDLRTTLKEPIEVDVEREGRLCIRARKLFEIVREVEGDLLLESVDEQWLKVKAGRSDFRLACLPASEFPAWPALGGEGVEEFTVDAKVLLEMIGKTIYCCAEGDARYTLNGLLFYAKPVNKMFTIVGTDGHRLALIVKEVEGEVKNERKVIVPKKAVSELRRFLDKEAEKVKISIVGNHLLFSVGEVQFLTTLIEGTYPNYELVIPRANKKKFSVGRDVFTKALRRVSIMSKELANAVRFDIAEDSLTISASNPDIGEAKEEVAIDYKGERISVGFNARYLLDALEVMMSERVILELNDPSSAVLLKEEGVEDYKCVVMPMRL